VSGGCARYPSGEGGTAAGAITDGRERRTRLVVLLALFTMLVELLVGFWSRSMALLADGWHMAGHAGALGLASGAYWLARRWQAQNRFAFGPAKVATLAGFASALLLAMVAVLMIVESSHRVVRPQAVRFVEALWIAVGGLAVNVISARLLQPEHPEDHHDHNLRSAYAHVVADALTSVLAIAALVAGHFTGITRLDALAGLVGSLVILWWAVGLLRATVPELVDMSMSVERDRVAAVVGQRLPGGLEAPSVNVRVWSLGGGRLACHLEVAAPAGALSAACRDLLHEIPAIHHLSTALAPPGSPGGRQGADLATAGLRPASALEAPREHHLDNGGRQEPCLLHHLGLEGGASGHQRQSEGRGPDGHRPWPGAMENPDRRDGNQGSQGPLQPRGL
jgi:cation diffusion facilitator family transporter